MRYNRIEHRGVAGSLCLSGRAGLTVLEFVGCAIAIVGGMWLGASYLGINIRHAAHAALTETQLIDKMPPSWRPPGPDDGVTREQLVATLREELSTLREEIAALRNDGAKTAPAKVSHERSTPAAEAYPQKSETASAQTRAYWQRISDIAVNEATLQREADASFTTENAAQVFALKARVSRVAAKAVQAVKVDDVDEMAIAFAQQLAGWYEHGGSLYERALQIWEMPTQGRAQLNEEWTRAESQHRNESQLLREKAAGTRGALGRQFGVEFPAFAEPAARLEAPKGEHSDTDQVTDTLMPAS